MFSPAAVDQSIPAATSVGPGMLSSSVTVNAGGTLDIQKLTVSLSIGAASDAGLTAVLIAPDGTQIPLFSGLSGANMINTVFDDSAPTSITQGAAPYTGVFQPAYNLSPSTLSSLAGKSADGTWTLEVTSNTIGAFNTLANWSLNITPVITVTPVAPKNITVNGKTETVATTFTVGFAQQQLSGTYSIQLGPNIEDQFGDQMDLSKVAGLNVLRGVDQNAPTTTMRYAATDLPEAIVPSTQVNTTGQPIPGTVSSNIVVPDSFMISGDTTAAGQSVMQVQLNLTYPNDPDLTATLSFTPFGDTQPMGSVVLFSDAGQGTGTANFSNTVFDDNAATPVQLGGAPFHAIFDPQQSLATVFAPAGGMNVRGTWTLTISNSSTTGTTGTLKDWSLTFQKPLPTNGMGVPGADQPTVSFRLSNLGQSSLLSSEAWSPVGDAASTNETGEVTAIATDPSDPSGNTVYVGGASGGVWKTTDFLTTKPGGPTWVPLTNFGPGAAMNISTVSIFPRNHNPAQSIIIVGTGGATGGEQGTSAPGVGFLVSMDGGATWNVYDSTVNVSGTTSQTSGNGQILPITSAARDRKFVGTIVNQIAIDPQLSPTGQVIIYAAVSGANGMGGIWESQNTGQSWTQVLNTGNATSVVLDQDSGIVLNPSTDTNTKGNLQIVYAGIYGQGVYMSTDQGQQWTLMNGGVGNPLIINLHNRTGLNANVNPSAPLAQNNANPNSTPGKIALSVPASTGNAVEDAIYAGWLYASVATQAGGFYGLYVTKDFGENWTAVQTPTLAPIGIYNQSVASNAVQNTTAGGTNVNYPIGDGTQGNVAMTLSTDPTNPNILYLGGFGGDGYNSDTGLIRIDITDLFDPHSLAPYGETTIDYTQGTPAWDQLTGPPVKIAGQPPTQLNPDPTAYLNFIRSPSQPFYNDDATLYVNAYIGFVNDGAGATFTPMDAPVTGVFVPPGSNTQISGTGYQASMTEVDPATGLTRLIVGNLDGVYSGLDNNGQFQPFVGDSDAEPSINRNGNLQLGQLYYGAVQPSSAAAQAARIAALRRRPEHRRPVVRSQPALRRQHHVELDRERRHGAQRLGHRRGPAGQRQPLPVLVGRPGRPVHQLPQGQRRGSDLRAAPGQQRHPDPAQDPAARQRQRQRRSPVAGHRDRQHRGQPGQQQRPARQLDDRERLRDHQPGRNLVPGGLDVDLRQPRQHQPRPGLRRPRSHGAGGPGQPGQLPLRRDGADGLRQQGSGLRQPGRRRHLGQHLAGPRRLPRPADHHRPDPGQPRRLRRHHDRGLLPPQLDPAGPEPHGRRGRVGQHHRRPQGPGLLALRPDVQPGQRQHRAAL